MYYYSVTIAYKGTHYIGWQAQSLDTIKEERPTVQGTIQNVLKKIAKYQPCTISAVSRTDRGVHAQGQRAKITMPNEIKPEQFLLGLNSLLPADIRILKCEETTKDYQPSRASVSKEYHYYFSTSSVENVAISDIAMHMAINNFEPETFKLLRDACQLFIGRHDFYSFSDRDKSVKTSVRNISYCDVHKSSFLPLAENMYYLKIIGDGFLRYMIRYLMGALIQLAKKGITLDDITLYLQQHKEDKLSRKAGAKGLHLIHIEESE
jgi:tRNA pseudouridine38-40 synthase